MKLYDGMPTNVLVAKLPSALRHAYLMKEPTSKLSSYMYNRPGGILVFLQNNTDMLSFIYCNNRFTMKF